MPDPTKAKLNGSGMVLTERDRQLIEAVATFGVLTREQIARHLKFGSVTRTNAVLLRLTRHRYLARRLQPTLRGTRRLTYTLGPIGAELLGRTERIDSPRRWRHASDLFLEHQLFVNDIRLAFIHLTSPEYVLERWHNERRLRELQLGVIPDGYCEYRVADKTFACFVEADNGTESQIRWRQKVAAYLDLAFSGRFATVFARQYFRVLVVTTSARRLANIRREIARQTDRLFWLTDRSSFVRRGPFEPIWMRPASDTSQSLNTSQIL